MVVSIFYIILVILKYILHIWLLNLQYSHKNLTYGIIFMLV